MRMTHYNSNLCCKLSEATICTTQINLPLSLQDSTFPESYRESRCRFSWLTAFALSIWLTSSCANLYVKLKSWLRPREWGAEIITAICIYVSRIFILSDQIISKCSLIHLQPFIQSRESINKYFKSMIWWEVCPAVYIGLNQTWVLWFVCPLGNVSLNSEMLLYTNRLRSHKVVFLHLLCLRSTKHWAQN